MNKNYYFSIYNHLLIIKDNQLISRKFIVLKDNNKNIVSFTDFHRYVRSKKTIRNITDDGNNRFDFVVKFLNYAFFERDINVLDNLSIEIVKDFMNGYGSGTLPGDEQGRTKSTVEVCIMAIMDFLEAFINERKSKCAIRIDELYKIIPVRNRRGGIINKKIPIFDVVYTNKHKDIFRDIPNRAFEILISYIASNHTDILMLVALSAFAGLRPSEACNVRREDSPLGAGLIFTVEDGCVTKLQIDLRNEICLRSDLMPTGRIKKERMQTVPIMFIDALTKSYNIYMKYMEGHPYEAVYGALSVNKQGKAITYDSYYQKFRKIIREEIIPIYLDDENSEVVNYGRLLLENNISPHVFRHWYTVQLVLSGMDNIGEIMYARGDTSPESSLTYLQNKGELEKQYRKVNNEMFNYLSWAAKKKHEEIL
ncbi:site-specific integrase [Anaerosporobacter faecicola]|uniref:site-specific integrase n=1 Tax=Anaerosporobacter faecicola TaxID=2718714 RepID=UPI00143BB989|nr:site-specific integrase [Anaerosporobacter faecicola]